MGCFDTVKSISGSLRSHAATSTITATEHSADHTAQAGLADQLGGLNLIQTDYNNDGCLDIFVLRGAWEFPQRPSLLRNNCDGTFTDIAAASGLSLPLQTQTGVWADIDNDGLSRSLFVGNENGPSHLYRNKGDGTFEEYLLTAAGIDTRRLHVRASLPLIMTTTVTLIFMFPTSTGDHFLYHNNLYGTRSPTLALQAAGVQASRGKVSLHGFSIMTTTAGPVVCNQPTTTSRWMRSVRSYLSLPPNADDAEALQESRSNGAFRDVTADVGLDRVFMPLGANFGDIDTDGYLDIYLGGNTGNPSYASLLPNVLLHNKEGKFFTDVTASSGTGELHKGHGVAFADIDNDGDEDLLTEIGGAVLGDSHAFRLFENPGNGNDWISLHLVGVKTNRAAIGARIKVTVQDQGQPPRFIFRTVGSGGSFGASPLTQHIGLGKAARILDLEITWPVSKTGQHFSNVAADQFLEIKEFAKDYEKLERRAFRLGRPHREQKSSAPEPPAPSQIRAKEIPAP